MGMLRGLAEAGADVVMHGLVTADEAKAKTSEIAREFSVQCRHSAADVTKPAEIRYWYHCCLLSRNALLPCLHAQTWIPFKPALYQLQAVLICAMCRNAPVTLKAYMPAASNDPVFTFFGCVQGHDKGHP